MADWDRYVNLGKTFSEKTVTTAYIKVSGFSSITMEPGDTAGTVGVNIYLQTYNGSSWSNDQTLATSTSGSGGGSQSTSASFTGKVNLNTTTIQGIRVRIHTFQNADVGSASSRTNNAKWYSLEYGDSYQTSSTVETNTIIDEVVPDSIVVYGKTDIPEDTSITVDVSDDGGSTWSLTDQELNSYIDTSSFTTGNLALKFNLATTDTSVTPRLYGFGIALTDS